MGWKCLGCSCSLPNSCRVGEEENWLESWRNGLWGEVRTQGMAREEKAGAKHKQVKRGDDLFGKGAGEKVWLGQADPGAMLNSSRSTIRRTNKGMFSLQGATSERFLQQGVLQTSVKIPLALLNPCKRRFHSGGRKIPHRVLDLPPAYPHLPLQFGAEEAGGLWKWVSLKPSW